MSASAKADQALAVPVEPVSRLDPTGVDPSRGVTMTVEAFAAYDTFPLGDKPLWAKCVKCAHHWAVAYLPMDMKTLAKVTKGGTKCPRCGDNKPVVARQANGVLLASAGEAWTATTVQQGVVHEHATGEAGDAQGEP